MRVRPLEISRTGSPTPSARDSIKVHGSNRLAWTSQGPLFAANVRQVSIQPIGGLTCFAGAARPDPMSWQRRWADRVAVAIPFGVLTGLLVDAWYKASPVSSEVTRSQHRAHPAIDRAHPPAGA